MGSYGAYMAGQLESAIAAHTDALRERDEARREVASLQERVGSLEEALRAMVDDCTHCGGSGEVPDYDLNIHECAECRPAREALNPQTGREVVPDRPLRETSDSSGPNNATPPATETAPGADALHSAREEVIRAAEAWRDSYGNYYDDCACEECSLYRAINTLSALRREDDR